MHFRFDQSNYPPDDLALITEACIKHCVDQHCTCDAGVHLDPVGLVVTELGHIGELTGIYISHTPTCYAAGRNN